MSPKNLLEVYSNCVSAAKAVSPLIVQNGYLFRWKGQVTSFVVAQLKFGFLPNFGLIVYDDSVSIPCLVIHPMTAMKKILGFCNKPLLFRDPQFVVEVVITESKQYDLVHLFIEIEKVHVVNERSNMVSISSGVSSPLNRRKCELDRYKLNFIPLKISSAILTLKSQVFCLVLSLLQFEDGDEDANEKEVWLILKNEQVPWKELLLPNRIYSIHLSSANSLNEMKNYKSLFSIADKHLDLSFQQMLHHKELIRTNVATFLPVNSQIISRFQRSNKLNFDISFSISDERLCLSKFASVCGIIKEVHYMESWKTLSCPWCDSYSQICDNIDAAAKIENNEHYSTDDSGSSESQSEQWDEMDFPSLKFESWKKDELIGFGIRGGKINVQITLQDVASGRIAYVFLKRWTLAQYPAGLIKGVTICFTDVNVKHSKKGNVYLVSTPLTKVVHLKAVDGSRQDSLAAWGRFGFPNVNYSDSKVWGMLDLDLLAKVSIITKCKLCGETFSHYRCPNLFCSNNNRPSLTNAFGEVTASARLFVRGISGSEGACLFLKNDNVRKYLCLPVRIWEKLCKLSAISELRYSHQTDDDSQQLEHGTCTDTLRTFFRLYCKYFRPRHRFHVSCATFKGGVTSSDRKYFCVTIEEVQGQRLAVTRAVVGETGNSC